MRRGLLLALVVVAAVAAAGAFASPSPQTVLGATWTSGGSLLARYDAATLERVGPTLRIAVPHGAWSYSPDRRVIALAGGDRSGGLLSFVDAVGLRRLGAMRLPAGSVRGLTWLARDRVLVVASGERDVSVLAIDPLARRVVGQVSLEGRLVRGDRTAARLVLLLAPREGIGWSRLALVQADLKLRQVELSGIASGWEPVSQGGEQQVVSRSTIPGLAVDRASGIAYVVGSGGGPVAAVDAASGDVAVHALVLRRPAKAMIGLHVAATWLGGGRLAITGATNDGLDPQSGRILQTPAGLKIVDTRTWAALLVDETADSLEWSGRWLVRTGADAGLTWYGPSGVSRGELFPTRRVVDVALLGNRALVRLLGDVSSAVVDLGSGKVVGRQKAFPPVFFLDGLSARMS
jgi:hypothetical protein